MSIHTSIHMSIHMYRQISRHVSRPLPFYLPIRLGMCINKCIDMCVDMYTVMWKDLGIPMPTHACMLRMRLCTCLRTCLHTGLCMSIHMSVHTSHRSSGRRGQPSACRRQEAAPMAVFRHAYRHVRRNWRGHVCGDDAVQTISDPLTIQRPSTLP